MSEAKKLKVIGPVGRCFSLFELAWAGDQTATLMLADLPPDMVIAWPNGRAAVREAVK
jgi:hypothetical protein